MRNLCPLPQRAECPKFEAELKERYEKLRQNYHEEQAKIASLRGKKEQAGAVLTR